MIRVDDLSRSLIAFEQNSTLVIVVELSQSSWLAAGVDFRAFSHEPVSFAFTRP